MEKQLFSKFNIVIIVVLLNSNIFSQLSDTTTSDFSSLKVLSNYIQQSNFSTSVSYLNKPQEFNPFNNEINYSVLAGMGAAFFGTATAVHLYQQKAWWSNQRTSFHFQNDWNYALGIDKIGHVYGAMLIQHGISSGLEAANLSSEQCVWYGSIAALSFQTFIEIEDGFGPQWGFSPGDFYSNIIGSAYPTLQYYFPFLKNFMLKASYWPRDLNKTNPVSGQKHIVADDYHGQKFWLSARVKNILPQSVENFWPEFLMFAVGMGVKNLDGNGGGQRDFYIALDLDAETIPLYGSFWQFVKNTLNFIHLPMPGVRVTSGGAFFIFCY